MRRTFLLGAPLACLAFIPMAAAGEPDLSTWMFTKIDVPFPDVVTTYVRDINSDGTIVGEYVRQGVRSAGFILKDGVFTTGISLRAKGGTDLRAINEDGHFVGNTFGGGRPGAGFLLKDGIITEFSYPGATATIAQDIDSGGEIVGYYVLNGVYRGFPWKDGLFTSVDFPGATLTTPRGINAQREIVGSCRTVDPDGMNRGHGFLLSKNGEFTLIGPGEKLGGEANGINPRGDRVGEYQISATLRLGYLFTKGEYILFGYPGAMITKPWKISRNGQHIVGFYDDKHGFIMSRNP